MHVAYSSIFMGMGALAGGNRTEILMDSQGLVYSKNIAPFNSRVSILCTKFGDKVHQEFTEPSVFIPQQTA